MKTLFFVLVLIKLTQYLDAHPLKMSYTSVRYIKDRKVFEVSHRVFQDDFENTLKSTYPFQGDIFINQNEVAIKNAVNGYFQKNFSISLNKIHQPLRYVKTEQKNQMGVIIYYETGQIDITNLSNILIFNSILVDTFKEQVNMFNLNINGLFKRTLTFNRSKLKEDVRL